MLTISQAQTDEQVAIARDLMREFTSWAITIEQGSEDAPTFKDLERELSTLPGIYGPPTGCLLIAIYDGQPAGCVCFKGHDAVTCELKRMYVRPDFRGQKIGWHLTHELMERARALGYQRMILDSHISMTNAHRLYKSVGFERVEAPDDFPEWIKPVVVFMECDLTVNT